MGMAIGSGMYMSMRVRTIKNKRQPHLRQSDKEVSRDVDFVRQNPMLVQDADKLGFVCKLMCRTPHRIEGLLLQVDGY